MGESDDRNESRLRCRRCAALLREDLTASEMQG